MALTVDSLAVAYVCCGLVPLALVAAIRSADPKPGKKGLVLTLVGLSIWSIAIGLLLVATATAQYRPLGLLFGLGGQLAAAGYFLLATEYTGVLEVSRRAGYAVVGAIAVGQLLAVSEPSTHLYLAGTTTPSVTDASLGPLGAVVVLGTIAIALSGLLLLVADVVATTGIRRSQSFVLVLAGVPTIVAYFADALLLSETTLTVLPVGLLCSAIVYAWAIVENDFLDVVPIGRKRIVEEMADAAVVVDADDRVVECNPAARRIVNVGPDYAGMSVGEFFDTVPAAVDRLESGNEIDTELAVDRDGERRHVHLTVSRLDDDRSSVPDGRLVVLRDITPLKRRERTLERRESDLEFVSQLLSRVLEHNVRNDLRAVRGRADLIATEADRDHADLAETIVETSDDLLETSRKARIVEAVIDRDAVVEPLDLAASLRDLATTYQGRYDGATISVSTPTHCRVETDPWLEYTFDILLENALEHAGDAPTVDVIVEREDDAAMVTIADDGPGIPRAELAVLERGEETPLEHTSGVGLWIVHWIVDRSAASITFDVGPYGTRVSIRIPTTPHGSVATDPAPAEAS